MNRKLLVTLLHKNIEELNMMTESFMEMNEYPSAIVHLARRKTEDIQTIIDQLAEIKDKAPVTHEAPEKEVDSVPATEIISELIVADNQPEVKQEETVTETEIIETVDLVEEVEEVTIVQTEEENKVIIETKVVKETTEILNQHETKITTDENRITTIGDKIVPPVVSRNEVLSKSDNSLSATIANKKIDDIKQAISIGDRFRFQRELFKGNGEDMNKTLSYINQLATLDEVSSFLMSKYGWDENSAVTDDFMQIVKRKFL